MRYFTLLLLILPLSIDCQNTDMTRYQPDDRNPFGQVNPEAPVEAGQLKPLIGLCDCSSVQRNPDGSWQDTVAMIWKFSYMLNGTAVLDETWKANGQYAASIRQYHPDSATWIVTYFSYPTVPYKPSIWRGGPQEDGNIVFTAPQTAPNGMEGRSRLTFHDISGKGYRWKGEWVSADGSIVYPIWTINCRKRE